jgi:hypothetical protein
MSKLGTAALSGLAFALVLLMPATTLASGGYGYHFVWDYCGGANGWTAYFKVRETANGTTSANRLTIDSWTQARDRRRGRGRARRDAAARLAQLDAALEFDGP